MTHKLYEQDSTLRSFCATVLSCAPAKGGYAIELDATAFFPEGGGQPADHGTLGGVTVSDVHEKNGIVLHYTDAPLTVGERVEGILDAARRDDLTAQHSGEHIVSGLIHATFGYDNVGFHLGSDVITIDFDGELTSAQLQEIEDAANAYIRSDLPVELLLPSSDELADLDYRSKKELTGQVRIIRFPGADTCACCGTHVLRTGQIGLVKLLSVQKFRSGCRIEMLAGQRAIDHLSAMAAQNRRICGLLSAKPGETAAAVQRLLEECDALRSQIIALQDARFASLAAEYAGADRAILFEPDLDAVAVRKLCVALMEQCPGLCAVFSGAEGSGYKYAIGQTDTDIRPTVKAMNAALSGRGGGKDPFFAQGSLQADRDAILAYFKALS